MISDNFSPIGYQALISLFNLQVIAPRRISYVSATGAKRILLEEEQELHIYPKDYQLSEPDNPLLHLEFAIKHEEMNLCIIKRVFEHLSIKQIADYIAQKPQGKVQRKIWYLFEFLMHKSLPISDLKSGNYVDLLDVKKYYTTKPLKAKRQLINDNLLGFSHFCPFVRRTASLASYEKKHLDKVAKKLLANYEPLIIQRAASYLYTKETLSSWHIEHEEPSKERALNFVKLLHQVEKLKKFDKPELITAQHIIVEPRFAEKDYRHTQNYIGEMVRRDYSIIHYVSPSPEDVPYLMHDLLMTLERMIKSNINPAITAAVISFGFVFIHPFEDGNGRIHRFLIHYILARAAFTPPGLIFPISAIMLSERKKYDEILEKFSRPLMDAITYTEHDNGAITAKNNTADLYAYLDYTQYAEYLFECIQKTIETDLRKELAFIVEYDRIKKAIQEIVDMPNKQLDLLIKLIVQNKNKLAQSRKQKFFPKLLDAEIKKIESIVKNRNTDVWPA